ncbi:unnamed protein product [Trifolium pratense]|uniref:Uncharacterized protein n=1 Tax=Trifolium pratense TaxID=57577 RepID=A0ACB0M5P8_TRIPR|nr:unnamed protein product [Trifolium pratense]
MDDDHELPKKSREVVLGLRKQDPVEDAEPINCAIPVKYEATECEAPAIHIDTSAYRPSNYKAKKKVSIEERGSRKIGCPFRLRGYLPKSKEWNLTIVSGIHNHVLDKALQGHLVAGRLKPEEKETVVEMTGNQIPPRNIMSTLKKRNPDSATSIKQLYNAKHRLKLAARGPRSEMQQLLKCLEENNYYFKVRTADTDEKKVVSAWTNRVMHFGNTTTNRAESSHAVLKKYLLDTNGDFVKVWGAIHDMLVNQHTEIQATFGISLSLQEHRYDDKPMYNLVVYKVSRTALGYIHEEAKRAEEVGMDSKKCGCVLQRTHGLPCACVLATKIRHNRPIRLDEINNHWKKLVFNDREDVEQQVDDYSCLAEWNAIQERLRTVDVPMKIQIREQLRQIAFPQSTSLKPPVVVGKNKGVKRKGACGESSMTRSPSYWEHVEVQFPPSQSSQATPSSSKQKGARTDMGHIIASYFNKVVVLLTKSERSGASETFFPLRGTPPQDPDSKILCIGGVPDHFVYVKLKQHCPLPPTCKTWTKYCTQEASSWQSSFVDRQADFVALMDNEKGAVVPRRKLQKGDSKECPIDCL